MKKKIIISIVIFLVLLAIVFVYALGNPGSKVGKTLNSIVNYISGNTDINLFRTKLTTESLLIEYAEEHYCAANTLTNITSHANDDGWTFFCRPKNLSKSASIQKLQFIVDQYGDEEPL